MSYENLKDILQQFRAEKKEYLDIILKVVPHRIHTLIPGMKASFLRTKPQTFMASF